MSIETDKYKPTYGKSLGKWLICWSALVLSSLCTSNSLAFDKEAGIRAVTLEYPPYESLESNEPKGIAVEIIKEAISRTGVNRISFEFHPWKWALSMTRTGKSDLLFNAGKDKDRQRWGYYVDSVLILQKYYLFKRADSFVDVDVNFSHVEDKSIAIRLGYLYGNGTFRKAIDSNQFGTVIYSYSTKQSVNMLLNDRVDFFVGDYEPVMHYLSKNGLLDKVDIVKKEGDYDNLLVLEWPTYMLFSKKTISKAYVEEVNNALEEMKADGTYRRILEAFGYSKPAND